MSSASKLAVALLALACAWVHAQPRIHGDMLTTPSGMTLYTNDNDKTAPGKSVCNGPCLALWKPFLADSGAHASGDFSLITRDDGKKQWAYKQMPLYQWVDDKKPGDTLGEGVRSVWHKARP